MVNIGMAKEARKVVAEKLYTFLATSYVLYLKTQNFHWNVKGKLFYSLHVLLEKHYDDLAEAIDEIAERIAALGHHVEGSFSAFAKASKIDEVKGKKEAMAMIEELLADHETLSQIGRPMIAACQEQGDEITADLLIGRLAFHEKAAWMLRSHLL